MSTIVVARKRWQYQDALRPYDIVVDGVVRAQVVRGGSATMQVEPGVHRIRAIIDRSGSQEIELEVQPSEERRLFVVPAAGPAITRTSGETDWLVLMDESDAPLPPLPGFAARQAAARGALILLFFGLILLANRHDASLLAVVAYTATSVGLAVWLYAVTWMRRFRSSANAQHSSQAE